ncbi:MAG: strawberry notch family protein [Nitratireductor sp.]|nr:strawberry notch family protein [Nitratireductor sp.]
MPVITQQEFDDLFGQQQQPTITSDADLSNRFVSSLAKVIASPVRASGEMFGSDMLTRAGESIEGGIDKAFPIDPSYEGIGRDLASGAGSMAGFMAPGGIVGAGPKVATGLAALLGSTSQGLAGLDEARQHGATPDQESTAFGLNSALGLSEAIPIGRFMGRAAPAAHEIAGDMTSAFTKFIKDSLKGAAEEGAQEGFQQFGQNVIAKDVAGYDTERGRTDDVAYNALLGAILGAPISGTMGLAGNAPRQETGEQPQDGLSGEILPPLGLPPGPEVQQAAPEPVTIDGEVVRPAPEQQAETTENYDFSRPLQGEQEISIIDPATGQEEPGFWHEATNRVRPAGERPHQSVLDAQPKPQSKENNVQTSTDVALNNVARQKPDAATTQNIVEQPAQAVADIVRKDAASPVANPYLLPAPAEGQANSGQEARGAERPVADDIVSAIVGQRENKAPPPAEPVGEVPTQTMEWESFSPESGTIGIPRVDMPQIKAEHRGAMVNFLGGKGVGHTSETVAADTLKPTQAEFSPEKVKKAENFEGGDRSILVSSDNHVVDGHHQWLAKRNAGEPVDIIRLGKPIKELLPIIGEFPSAENSDASARDVGGHEENKPHPGRGTPGSRTLAQLMAGVIPEGGQANPEEPIARKGPEATEPPPTAEVKPAFTPEQAEAHQWLKDNGHGELARIMEMDADRGYAGALDDAVRRAKVLREAKEDEANWPEPNDSGVYSGDDVKDGDRFAMKGAHAPIAEIELLAVAPNRWVARRAYHLPEIGGTNPLSGPPFFGERQEALDAAISSLRGKFADAVKGSGPKAQKEQAEAALKWLDSVAPVAGASVRNEVQEKPGKIDEPATGNETAPAGEGTPHVRAAREISDLFGDGLDMPTMKKRVRAIVERAYGGTVSQGAYATKDAYEALELGLNLYISRNPDQFNPANDHVNAFVKLTEMLDRLPRQRSRDADTDAFQQFSTPPQYGFVASWLANIKPGETVMEPSAGNGGIAVFAKNAGAKTIVNEIDARRVESLNAMGFDKVYSENAEQLNNILPKDVMADVVVMNPPFGNAGTRGMSEGADLTRKHIDQALKRLKPGGRLVAITGYTFHSGNRKVAKWFAETAKKYNIRAGVRVDGKEYGKFDTTYDTRLWVIDNTGPTQSRPMINQEAVALEPLFEALKDVHDTRSVAEQGPAESQGGSIAETSRRDAGPDTDARPATPELGGGERGNRADETGRSTVPDNGGGIAGQNAGSGADLAGDGRRERTERDRASAGRVDADRGGGASPRGDQRKDQDAGKRVTVEEAADVGKTDEELTESIFSNYRPQRARIKGAKPHPSKLVQSAAMGSVVPPKATYAPHLPDKTIDDGLLSDAQLENVVYAGQAHEEMLPAPAGEQAERRGYFIGDGTGVGKGRQISGIIMDNLAQGRKKHVWISEKWPLFNDAKRDMKGAGGDASLLISQKSVNRSKPIDAGEGVLFTTYSTLAKTFEKEDSNFAQLVNWLGKDFDGVIAFDEAHNMGNAVEMKGKRGKKKPSQAALAGVELQKRLPNARVVYVSATGATEVANLSYASRLGLWGFGTPFASRDKFIQEVTQGGVAAMELVARDLKALGSYQARSLSYDGVSYSKLEHALTAPQREIYDTLAKSWQSVLERVNEALKVSEGAANANAKSAALSAFWGSHQRFFNQVLTALQMPSVIRQAEKDLAAGDAVVMQIVNTNESSTERALAKIEDQSDLEDLDLTPREQLMAYVQNSFPVAQHESYVDEDGNQRSRPVTDSNGNPVENAEAVAMREDLLDRLSTIKVPDGPLETLIDHFGADKVAEVTGRSRRIVTKGGKRVIEKRGARANEAETDAFMSGDKDILIFSDAGGTGRSYHADLTQRNQKRRKHYLVQPGWRADKAVQGFGRTHRTAQASAPHYYTVSTDIQGHKRFVSSIARRLDQLGALTKGQRDAGSQGMFTALDNLESDYAKDAMRTMFYDIARGNVPGLDISQINSELGLKLINSETGAFNDTAIPEIPQFLNRILSMTIERQNRLFNEFVDRLQDNIEAAKQRGDADLGIETIRADKSEKKDDRVVFTDPKSGAETRLVEVELSHRNDPLTWEMVKDGFGGKKIEKWARNKRSGTLYGFVEAKPRTDRETGAIIDQFRRLSPLRTDLVDAKDVTGWGAAYEEVGEAEAKTDWDKRVEESPEYRNETVNMIVGAILPIWDRLPRGENMRIYRMKADDGEVLLGRVLRTGQVAEVLRNLGAEGKKIVMSPAEIRQRVLDGGVIQLSNGWRLKSSMVDGGARIEIVPKDAYSDRNAIQAAGAMFERIDYRGRYFVPLDPSRFETTMRNVLTGRDIVAVGSKGEDFEDAAGHYDGPGEAAKRHVVEAGKRDGVEHLVMIDGHGNRIGVNSGSKNNVQFTEEMLSQIRREDAHLIVHHNHPSSHSLSPADIMQLANPGIYAVYAHGHNGTSFRASLNRDVRESLMGYPARENLLWLRDAAERAYAVGYRILNQRTSSGKMKIEDAQAVDAHLMNLILRESGMIDYATELTTDLETDPEFVEAKKAAIEDIAKRMEQLINGGKTNIGRANRRTQPARHLGDLAEFLEGSRGSSRKHDQGRDDPKGARRDFEEEEGLRDGFFEDVGKFEEPSASLWHVPDRGTFQILRNANIKLAARFRAAFSAQAMQTAIDKWRVNFQDRFLPVLRVEEAIERFTGDQLPQGMKVYLAEEMYTGRVGSRLDRITRRYVEPIGYLMRESGLNQDDVGEYLYARHAQERNEHIASINPNFEDGGSGMSDAEARGILRDIKSSEQSGAYELIGKLVDRMMRESVRARVDAGLLSEQAAEAWQKYQHYVPLRGFEEVDEADPGIPNVGKGFTARGPESRRALGRESKAGDILATAFTVAQEAVIRGEKNRVVQRLFDLAKAHPNKDYWEINPVRMKQVFNRATGMVYSRAESPIAAGEADKTVSVKFKGVEHRIVINDERLREAIKRLNAEDLNGMLKFMIGFNRFLSTMNTSLNPEFLVSNAIRDLQTAGVHMATMDQKGLTKAVLKDYFGAMRGAWGGLRGKPLTTEWRKVFREFERSGGKVSFYKLDGIEDLRAKFEKISRQMSAKDYRKVWQGIKALGQVIEDMNLAVDNAVRLSLFKNLRERGVSVEDAASAAKNLTVNFNRRGQYATTMNALYLFYNAGVQGSAIMLKAMQHRRARHLAGAMVAGSAALTLLNALFLGEDDENGENEYAKIPEWEKQRNLVVMIPGKDDRGRQNYVKFPLPYGYNVFHTVGRKATEYAMGLSDGAVAMGDIAETFIDSFNPVGGSDSILKMLSPTITDPLVEINQNSDFAGRKIRPDRTKYDDTIPFSQDYYNSVSPLSRHLTAMLNEWTGGNEFKPGKVDLSPEWIDHVGKFIGGAAVSTWWRPVNTTSKLLRGEEINPNDIPFERRVHGRTGAFFDRDIFYSRVDEIEQAAAQTEGFAKKGDRASYDALDDKTKALGAMKTKGYRAMQSKLRDLRKKRNEIYAAKLDAATRSETLKRIEDEEMRIISAFNRAYLQTARRVDGN